MGAVGLPRHGAPTGIAVLGHGSGPTRANSRRKYSDRGEIAGGSGGHRRRAVARLLLTRFGQAATADVSHIGDDIRACDAGNRTDDLNHDHGVDCDTIDRGGVRCDDPTR